MSQIAVYDVQGNELNERYTEHAEISAKLASLGLRFERWQASQPLSAEAGQEEVLAAYRSDVERLSAEYGFQSADVVSIRPDNPQKEEFRQKFLAEHTHSDFEVRFFVEGRGLFYLHIGDRVYLVECEQGDLISVPAGVTHWFDMGETPDFKCIRLFVTPEGWVGNFTGSDIATTFPSYEQYLARMA